ncbi:hypothetical protein EZS27_034038, partial [termite gut metagenome]
MIDKFLKLLFLKLRVCKEIISTIVRKTNGIRKSKLATLLPRLDEHTSRLYLGSEALSSGRGGKQKASRLAGVSR